MSLLLQILVLDCACRLGDFHNLLPDGDRSGSALWSAQASGGEGGDDVSAAGKRLEAVVWSRTYTYAK